MFKFIKKILYALPFGMKAADEMLATASNVSGEGTSIEKHVEKKSVLNDLLNGEVTQEVEELRYETFKAEELSNEYQYIGNGVAMKKEGTDESIKNKRKRFVQENFHQDYGVLESMSILDGGNKYDVLDVKPRSIFKFLYGDSIPKYRFENVVNKVMVNLDDNSYKTTLCFVDDKMNRKARPLINFIKKTEDKIKALEEEGNEQKIKAFKEKNELYNCMTEFSFTTFNASNDVPNGVDYHFTGPTLSSILCDGEYAELVYTWRKFDGNVLLSERFKSKTAEEKFAKKEKREGFVPVVDMNAKVNDETKRDINREMDNESLENWLNEVDTVAPEHFLGKEEPIIAD